MGDIEIAHVMCAARRQCIDDSVGKVVTRIDHGNPVAGIDVVHGQVEQHGTLARVGFTDDVEVPLALPRARALSSWNSKRTVRRDRFA